MLSVVLDKTLVNGIAYPSIPIFFAIRQGDGPILTEGDLYPTAQNDVVYALYLRVANTFLPATIASINLTPYLCRNYSNTYLSITRRRESARDRAMNRELRCIASGVEISSTLYPREDNIYSGLQHNTPAMHGRSANPNQPNIHGAHIFPIARLNNWIGGELHMKVQNDGGVLYTNNYIKKNRLEPVDLSPHDINSLGNIVAMQSQYHTAFDAHQFAIHPGTGLMIPFNVDFHSLPQLLGGAALRTLLGTLQPYMANLALLRMHFDQACLRYLRLDRHNVWEPLPQPIPH